MWSTSPKSLSSLSPGTPPSSIRPGDDYSDLGATVADASGNAIDNPSFTIGSNIDITQPGTYSYTYDFTDGQNNTAATAVRTVVVVDLTAPTIQLLGGDTIEHQLGNPFVDPGFSAVDAVDGDVAVTNSILRENVIRASSFQLDGFPDSELNLDNNRGLLARIPVDTVDFNRGPHNTGLYISEDANFRLVFPGITRNDNFKPSSLAISIPPPAAPMSLASKVWTTALRSGSTSTRTKCSKLAATGAVRR